MVECGVLMTDSSKTSRRTGGESVENSQFQTDNERHTQIGTRNREIMRKRRGTKRSQAVIRRDWASDAFYRWRSDPDNTFTSNDPFADWRPKPQRRRIEQPLQNGRGSGSGGWFAAAAQHREEYQAVDVQEKLLPGPPLRGGGDESRMVTPVEPDRVADSRTTAALRALPPKHSHCHNHQKKHMHDQHDDDHAAQGETETEGPTKLFLEVLGHDDLCLEFKHTPGNLSTRESRTLQP